MTKEFIENLPETFPGGGYYIDKELGVMPCKPEQGLPTDNQGKTLQKIDILAQELEGMVDSHFKHDLTSPVASELRDIIKELNGQTILLLRLFCMESEVITRGNNDDEEKEGRGRRDSTGNETGQTEISDQDS